MKKGFPIIHWNIDFARKWKKKKEKCWKTIWYWHVWHRPRTRRALTVSGATTPTAPYFMPDLLIVALGQHAHGVQQLLFTNLFFNDNNLDINLIALAANHECLCHYIFETNEKISRVSPLKILRLPFLFYYGLQKKMSLQTDKGYDLTRFQKTHMTRS